MTRVSALVAVVVALWAGAGAADEVRDRAAQRLNIDKSDRLRVDGAARRDFLIERRRDRRDLRSDPSTGLRDFRRARRDAVREGARRHRRLGRD